MAVQVKVKTFYVPNLSQQDGNVSELEENIENWIKNKIGDGFTFLGSVGGDCYTIIILKKET